METWLKLDKGNISNVLGGDFSGEKAFPDLSGHLAWTQKYLSC